MVALSDIELDLDAGALAQVNEIRRGASLWASLTGKSSSAQIEDPEKSLAVMSEAEREAALVGLEVDDPQLQKASVEVGPTEAELYESHMRGMAAELGIDVSGMNIDEITDQIQAAQENGGVAPQQAMGENAVANFMGWDIKSEAVDMNLAEIEQAGSPLPTAVAERQDDLSRMA